MTSAIFEILALLAVSCLIGVFFTYRFWKAKYTELVGKTDLLTRDVARLEGELQKEKTKSIQLQEDLALATTRLEKAENSVKQQKVEKKAPVAKDNNADVKKFKDEISLLKEQMEEKEREIEVLSRELEKSKISYYKQINGRRYKAITLKMADEAVAGQGDGRISKEDAEKIFATISDGKAYTQVEKHTMRYLRDNYKWTEGADGLFRTKVRSWAARGHELD